MSFGERIKQFIDYKRTNVSAFEVKSKLKNGAIYRVVKNNTSLNGESIASIGREWPDLNLNWLMNGEGNMLLKKSIFTEPTREYNKEVKMANEIEWYKDSLRRADEQIEIQKEVIANLKNVIKRQIETAKKAGIEL